MMSSVAYSPVSEKSNDGFRFRFPKKNKIMNRKIEEDRSGDFDSGRREKWYHP